MIRKFFIAAFTAFVLMAALPSMAAPKIGEPAPDFKGIDSNGVEQTLDKYKGKIVVLEWTNPECPFVKKHYQSHNMQKLQGELTATDTIWLSINSSGEGMQGHQTPEEANKYMQDTESRATARILDSTGEIGKLYGAKTTPHMFVIDANGKLVYEGAIDDNDSTNPEDAAKAKNYVREAVNALMLQGDVKTPQTKPYGCSVKYSEESAKPAKPEAAQPE